MDSSFWVPLGVLIGVPAAIFTILQITDRFNLFAVFRGFSPVVYRVTNVDDGRGLWTTEDDRFDPSLGKTKPPTWSFTANKGWIYVIEGPMLRKPLRPGKYRATYRFKVHDNNVDVQATDRYILRMEVLSHVDGRKDTKLLVGRTLTTYDFEKADEYKDFPLEFEVYSKNGGGEQKVEFCTMSWQSGIRVTFDSVRLSRR